ncbi:hypothetical protein H0H93_006929, partial [Arthromyces matolae]
PPPNTTDSHNGNNNFYMQNADLPVGLDRLLGRDVNAYVEEHAEKYERAVERWKGCTMEEWIAGAEGALSAFGFQPRPLNVNALIL